MTFEKFKSILKNKLEDIEIFFKNKLEDIEIFFYRLGKKLDVIELYYRMKKHGILLRSHRLNIKTLPARWIDKDEVMLHANFQILVNFIEQECANMGAWCEVYDSKDKRITPMERGLLYLEEHIKDKNHENKNCRAWAKASSEMADLYIWWVYEREHRPTFSDIVNDYRPVMPEGCDFSTEKRIQYLNEHPEIEEQYKVYSEQVNKYFQLEEAWKKEDEKQLMRLIKIRGFLWT